MAPVRQACRAVDLENRPHAWREASAAPRGERLRQRPWRACACGGCSEGPRGHPRHHVDQGRPRRRGASCRAQNASGLASRAMWSSTALTNFASRPSGKKARVTSTYSEMITRGGVSLSTNSAPAARKSARWPPGIAPMRMPRCWTGQDWRARSILWLRTMSGRRSEKASRADCGGRSEPVRAVYARRVICRLTASLSFTEKDGRQTRSSPLSVLVRLSLRI